MIYDLIICGGGPAGIYAASLSGYHGLSGLLIEAKDKLGGQVSEFYPQKDIIDLPSHARITGEDYINALVEQYKIISSSFPLRLNEEIISITKQEEHFKVMTNKESYLSKVVLLTTGIGRPIPLRGEFEDTISSSHIFHNIVGKKLGESVTILGGGDSAADWALHLVKEGKEVNLVHRRKEFRASNKLIEEFIARGGNVFTPYLVRSACKENEKISLTIYSPEDEKTILSDDLFINFGFKISPLDIGVAMENDKYLVDHLFSTKTNNIFAVGDAVYYPGKINNLTQAMGEVNKVINHIDKVIHPEKIIKTHL